MEVGEVICIYFGFMSMKGRWRPLTARCVGESLPLLRIQI